MLKNRCRLGLRPRPRWGSLRRSPDPLVGWGGGFPPPQTPPHSTPPPDSTPLDAFGVSVHRLRRLKTNVPPTNFLDVPLPTECGLPCERIAESLLSQVLLPLVLRPSS